MNRLLGILLIVALALFFGGLIMAEKDKFDNATCPDGLEVFRTKNGLICTIRPKIGH